MAELSGIVGTIVQDVKDGKITVEEIQEGLLDGDFAKVNLESEAKEALEYLQSHQPQQ